MFITTSDVEDLHAMNCQDLWARFDISRDNKKIYSKDLREKQNTLIREIISRVPLLDIPTLTPRERQIIQLFYIESKSLAQIADELKLSVEDAHISTLKRKALQHLRNFTLLKDLLAISNKNGLPDIDVERAWNIFDEMPKGADRRSIIALVFRGRLNTTLRERLPDIQYAIVEEYANGVPVPEIASAHCYCIGTVHYHLRKAMKVLRNLSLKGLRDVLPVSMDEFWIRYFATKDPVTRRELAIALMQGAELLEELHNQDDNITQFKFRYGGTTFHITLGG